MDCSTTIANAANIRKYIFLFGHDALSIRSSREDDATTTDFSYANSSTNVALFNSDRSWDKRAIGAKI